TAIDIIRKAIEAGYRHLDSAQLYDNEKEVGNAIIHSEVPRSDIFLTTKIWPSNLTKELFIPSVEESLEKLQTEYVDLLLIHWPDDVLPVEEYIHRLMHAQELGLTKNIGVSNFNISQLNAALKEGAKIVTNQVEFHPWINQTKLQLWMKEHDLPLTAYCPLGQGKLITYKKLEALAAQYGKSPAQIILRWMMQKENILAIPKSANLNRLKENISVFDFELANTEIEMIDAWRLENIRIVGVQAGAKWE
ncbi:MAG TPA: aldo/keto reductase, partial [Saprospiraceae bacterium]|nr:aldo/keto reductase [Saprospiraceae bacterium]